MDTVVMELEDNPDCGSMNLSERKNKQSNVRKVKLEAPEADDILLRHDDRTSKPENVCTDEQLESASLNTFDADEMSNQSLEIKWETVAQDSDEEISVKEELLHEELDIKSEDEATLETPVEENHNLGNKFHKHRKHPCGVKPFKTHLITHTGEKPFKCNICNYSCGQNSNLKTHLRTHTGEKPFKCNVCDYSSSDRTTLKNHLRTHTGEKPFKCTVCDYSCGRNGDLKIHLRTHTGEKPFKCTICEYSCGQQGHLNAHLRTHTGEKPFKCNICEYSATRKSHLDRHLRTHTGVKSFKCDVCNKTFSQKIHLQRHMITHSIEKPC